MNVVAITFGGGAPPISALTTILSGLAVALVAGIVLFALNWLREHLTTKWKRNSEASVLAFTIASQLDEFISQCSDVVAHGYDFDEQSGNVMDAAKPTKLSLSNDLPWSVLDKNLQHQIRSLPNEVDVANRTLDASWREEHIELLDVLQEREELYAQIGLKALALNKTLAERYDVPLLNRRDWHPEKIFKSSLENFATHRAIVKNLSSKIELPDLLPPTSSAELSRRHMALSADLKAAADRRRVP